MRKMDAIRREMEERLNEDRMMVMRARMQQDAWFRKELDLRAQQFDGRQNQHRGPSSLPGGLFGGGLFGDTK